MQSITLEDDLEELAQRLAALDWIDASACLLDSAGEIRYANPAFRRLNETLRAGREDFGRHTSLLDCPLAAEAVAAAVADGEYSSVPLTLYYSPQIPVEVTLCLTPVRDTTGGTAGLLLTLGEESLDFGRRHLARLQDDRRRFRDRIRQLTEDKNLNDRLIRILLKEMPIAIVLMNSERQILQLNRAAERLFGLTAKQLTGKSCEALIDCYSDCTGCPALAGSHSIHEDETLGHAAQGNEISLLRSVVCLEDNRDTLILEAFIDVSERRRSEQELKRLSEYNELLLNSTGEGIFGVDMEMRCTFANRAAAEMLGYAPDDMVGEDIHQLIHSRHEDGRPLERAESPIDRCMLESRNIEIDDGTYWHRNGESIPVRYLCNPIYEDGRVTGAVVVYRNIAEARIMARKMDYLAKHCPLTGLLNRRVFESRLEELMAAMRHGDPPHALCYIDLDQFKIVNDTCGHAAGDELLRQLGGMFHRVTDRSDILARLGGDEFGIIFAGCSPEEARERLITLLDDLNDYRFVWDGKPFALGASIGMVMIDADLVNAGDAMVAADTACYAAKEQGRNRIHVYQNDDIDLQRRKREMQWATQIREALEQQRLCLYYQPIVALDTPDVMDSGLEILVRMKDENGDLIMPGAFIPAAERFDLMPTIDRWVVNASLDWLDQNYDSMSDFRLCSINLSAQSICDERFVDFLIARLETFCPPCDILCFEITETSAVSNLSRAVEFINRVRRLGCAFALDDFGSGMSSFSYLKNLPVDYLKIDGNFVKDILTDQTDYAMVEAIHKVASIMGLKTIAEFIEDSEVLAALRRIGIDHGQGYGISRPRPLPDNTADRRSRGA